MDAKELYNKLTQLKERAASATLPDFKAEIITQMISINDIERKSNKQNELTFFCEKYVDDFMKLYGGIDILSKVEQVDGHYKVGRFEYDYHICLDDLSGEVFIINPYNDLSEKIILASNGENFFNIIYRLIIRNFNVIVFDIKEDSYTVAKELIELSGVLSTERFYKQLMGCSS